MCTLDSASSVSMMSESTVHHYKFPIHPSDIQIKSANNAVTSVVGVTDSLLIDIQGQSCQVTFIVLHHDDHEILLGLDWFKLTGASLHPHILDANIIRPSRSPQASPVILVPKKDNSIRMCVDFRRLNKVTVSEIWPLPRIDDILDCLLRSKWFSTLDLKSGYYQVAMSPQSISETAFITPNGHYEFLRLPFGLKTVPSHFSKTMFQALGDFSFVKIYLDDITFHPVDFTSHLHHIKQVLQRLTEVNLKLNSTKCTWFASRVTLLGHVVTPDGIIMDPAKVEAVQSFKPPQNAKHVQQFFGICNYYSRFIKDFAKISQPIAKLICKDVPFI
jgi:hypothetical protein